MYEALIEKCGEEGVRHYGTRSKNRLNEIFSRSPCCVVEEKKKNKTKRVKKKKEKRKSLLDE